MSYIYAGQKPTLWTDEGIMAVLKVYENVMRLHEEAGAFSATNAMAGVYGDSWLGYAALDFLCEKGLAKCVSMEGLSQHWVYVKVVER